MGSEFARDVLGIESPRVGLLSIGEEASKGTAITLEAHALLAASELNFGGNCEGRDVLTGEFQVVVADGFAGNVLLKGLEGAGVALFTQLRAAADTSLRAKIGGLLLRPAVRAIRTKTDPENYGGAYLLGVRGVVSIAHGNSNLDRDSKCHHLHRQGCCRRRRGGLDGPLGGGRGQLCEQN